MKKAKPEHRLDYWRYHVAAHSFDQARGVCDQLQGLTDQQPLFLPLMIALHVLYARPFKHKKESRRMNVGLVPAELKSVHDMLLRMRDRIYAHHDRDSRITDAETGVDLFQLVMVVTNGQMRPGVQLVFPTDFQRTKVRTLCDSLYRTCMEKAETALTKCLTTVPEDGLYRVSTDFQHRAPLLIRSEWSTEQSGGHLRETVRRTPG